MNNLFLAATLDAIGGYSLKDITPSILQDFYDRLDEKELKIVRVKAKEKRLM